MKLLWNILKHTSANTQYLILRLRATLFPYS
jgi:hypothetical protein